MLYKLVIEMGVKTQNNPIYWKKIHARCLVCDKELYNTQFLNHKLFWVDDRRGNKTSDRIHKDCVSKEDSSAFLKRGGFKRSYLRVAKERININSGGR